MRDMNLSDEADVLLSPRGRQLVGVARDFAAGVVEQGAEAGQGWTRATLQQACAVGLAGIEVPEADGGAGQPAAPRKPHTCTRWVHSRYSIAPSWTSRASRCKRNAGSPPSIASAATHS